MAIHGPQGPATRARVLIVLAALGLLSALAGAAHAGPATSSCEPFEHVQTYRGDRGFFRAPAWHYGRTVTVAYTGRRCISAVDDVGSTVTTIEGTATVHRGSTSSGATIDRRTFTSSETRRVVGPAGVAWWTCDDAVVRYSWVIDDVYSFSALGKAGAWSFRQSALGTRAKSFSYAFSGCSAG